ncbi:MAG: GNAT family N-acetyltransferase [Thermomicrobiales bacterium]
MKTTAPTHTIPSEEAATPAAMGSRLDEHFRRWLGSAPIARKHQLIISEERNRPGWDGRVRPIQGITGPQGSVLAVAPQYERVFASVDLSELIADLHAEDPHLRLAEDLGGPVSFGMPVFRWSERAAEMPDLGEWVDADDPRLPDWLRPFNGGVLAAFDDDDYMAGVGIKQHNEIGREISVGTDPNYRGQGLATQLVAQAARAIIAAGGVPLYQHGEDNIASARVADAAGFPDRGWHMIEIRPDPEWARR